jgi:ABC-type antimicrobial peptide transport system permease subunit
MVLGLSSGFGLIYFFLHAIACWINLPQPILLFSSHTQLISGAVIIVSAVVSSAYPADRVAKL